MIAHHIKPKSSEEMKADVRRIFASDPSMVEFVDKVIFILDGTALETYRPLSPQWQRTLFCWFKSEYQWRFQSVIDLTGRTVYMIEIVNRQRKVSVDPERWQLFTSRALKATPAEAENVTIAFVSDRHMQELNRQWRGKTGTTDVLSFPAGEDEFANPDGSNLGDVVISLEQAARQAKEHEFTIDEEIAQLILHGLLHLCGYNHETDNGEMNRLELKLRKKLRI
jgi:probable rRNA maturation factor